MKPKWTNMLVNRRHHCALSVTGPKSEPKAMACSGVGSMADTPRRTMMAKTKTLAAIRMMVTGKGGCENVSACGGSEALMVCACWWSQAGQLRDGEEPPKGRSNSLPQ